MNGKGGFSKAPGSSKPPADPNAFIEAAGKTPPAATVETYPWEGLDDTKRREPFNVRFTDVEKEMLKYIDENTKDSMHAFCISVLRPALRAKISELTGVELGPDIPGKIK